MSLKILSERSKERFMSQDPFVYGEHANVLGQRMKFLEHPTQGDTAPVYALVEADGSDYLVNTDFYDVEDLLDPEYEVVIFDGQAMCGWELAES